VTPETDATPALDGTAPDSRSVASREREPCFLLAGAPARASAALPFSGLPTILTLRVPGACVRPVAL